MKFCFLNVLCVIVIAFSSMCSAESSSTFHDTGLICAVDMGSNTFKFIVAEIKNGEYLQYIDDRKTAGVGDDLRESEAKSGHKVISGSKLAEIKSLLNAFQDQCEQKTHSRKIHGIATAAFREAENLQAISKEIQKMGVDMDVLSGEGESIFAYEASTLGEPGFAVIDLGSRTTEFVNRIGETYHWKEIPTGYKNSWDDFYANSKTFVEAFSQHINKLKEIIGENEERILLKQKELIVIEVGETASYVLGVPQDQIERKIITHLQVRKKLNNLFALDSKSFEDLKNNFQDVAKVLPRLVLLDFILSETGYERFRGTDRQLNAAIIYRLAR